MKSERQKLIKKLDTIFSRFIRQRDKGVCITCGRSQEWKLTDCGHYIRRGVYQFRWNEKNCNCQCKKCNGWNEGEKDIYRRKLVEMYGKDIIEIMEADRHKPCKISIGDIRVLIAHYTKKLGGTNGKVIIKRRRHERPNRKR